MLFEPPIWFFEKYNEMYVDLIGLYRFKPEQLMGISTESSVPFNHELAGHIVDETLLSKDSINIIDELVTPVAIEYDNYMGMHQETMMRFDSNYRDNVPKLKECWVNKQKKHEYNPAHQHAGLYSFVIWLDIPYTVEEETAASPFRGNSKQYNTSGAFSFISSDRSGRPIAMEILADKKWNGTLAIFPSFLIHQVYPFYSTDKERVTIAGNYFYEYLNS